MKTKIFNTFLILLILTSCSLVPKHNSKDNGIQTTKNNDNYHNLMVKEKSSQVIGTFTCDKKSVTGVNIPQEIPNQFFDIPVIYNKDVEKWVKYFTGKGRKWTEIYLDRSTKLTENFSTILKEANLPQDLIFLAMAESGFKIDIMSHAKAVGAWQFMDFTGRRYGLEIDYFYDERRDPTKSAQAAAKYLKDLYEMFGSWELAMAAYNAGENKISKAIIKYKTTDFWQLRKGKYLKPETKNYVPKIMALAIIGKNLDFFGFQRLEVSIPKEVSMVKIPPQTDIEKIAIELDLNINELKELNPLYSRWHTPLENKEYELIIPKNKLELFQSLNLSHFVANSFAVSPYKNIEKASKKHKIPLPLLKELNKENSENIILPYRVNHSPNDPMYADLKQKKKKNKKKRLISMNK